MINHYEYAKSIALIKKNGNKAIGTSESELAAKVWVDTHSKPPITLKTFSEATEEELVATVQAADDGLIDLYDDAGWRVGQEREVSISAISSSGTGWSVGESQPAQTATLVLMHKGDYELVTPVKAKGGASRSTCSFVVGMKNSVSYGGYIHPNTTSSFAKSWFQTDRADWCNRGFYGALSANIQSLFKKFIYKTYNFEFNRVYSFQAYFVLPAEYEVFGMRSYSMDDEANALFQFDWYKTAENRIKNKGGYADAYWTRSPSTSGGKFVYVSFQGIVGGNSKCTVTYGISPFGCV